jgi:protein-tyrosine-phosphatase
MKKILFVCTGNTCRSSMAEAIARKELQNRNKGSEIEVMSAGISAFEGDRASEQAIAALDNWGIDLRGHMAKRLSIDLINKADLILTMTESHKWSVIMLGPGSKNKVFTLKEYVDGKSGDIPDPYGAPVEVYRECAGVLREYIIKALDKFI